MNLTIFRYEICMLNTVVSDDAEGTRRSAAWSVGVGRSSWTKKRVMRKPVIPKTTTVLWLPWKDLCKSLITLHQHLLRALEREQEYTGSRDLLFSFFGGCSLERSHGVWSPKVEMGESIDLLVFFFFFIFGGVFGYLINILNEF